MMWRRQLFSHASILNVQLPRIENAFCSLEVQIGLSSTLFLLRWYAKRVWFHRPIYGHNFKPQSNCSIQLQWWVSHAIVSRNTLKVLIRAHAKKISLPSHTYQFGLGGLTDHDGEGGWPLLLCMYTLGPMVKAEPISKTKKHADAICVCSERCSTNFPLQVAVENLSE